MGGGCPPQTGGQTERVNQILEDMLRACVISLGKDWEKFLPFDEFTYNNSYQASLGKAPFEVLYGRRCRTPLNWSETAPRLLCCRPRSQRSPLEKAKVELRIAGARDRKSVV